MLEEKNLIRRFFTRRYSHLFFYIFSSLLAIPFHIISLYLTLLINRETGLLLDLLSNNNTFMVLQKMDYILRLAFTLFVPCIIYRFFYSKSNTAIDLFFRGKAINYLLNSRITYIETMKEGRYFSDIIGELSLIKKFLSSFCMYMIEMIFIPLLSILILLKNSGKQMIYPIVIFIPVLIYILIRIYINSSCFFKKYRRAYAYFSNYISQCISNLPFLLSYNLQSFFYHYIKKSNQNLFKAHTHIKRNEEKIKCLFENTRRLINLFAILLSIYLCSKRIVSPGDLFTFFMYTNLILSVFKERMVQFLDGLICIKTFYKRYRLLQNYKTYANTSTAEDIDNINSIELKNLSYSYGHKIIFNNVNLKINKGEKIGITGLTGCGKTTLLNLISGLYDIPDSMIFINGIDINKLNKECLFRCINYSLQCPQFFNNTIESNINVNSICKSHSVTQILNIVQLNKERQYMVGENGFNLSGGQKQKLAIARSIANSKSLNIFDDATSAIDPHTEKLIVKAILNLNKENILIIASNKTSLLKNLDTIIVLNNRSVEAIGNHNNLLNTCKLYKTMHEHEVNNYLTI